MVFGIRGHDGARNTMFSRFLDTVGNGTGTKNAIGDQTGTTIRLTPGAGEIYRVARMLVTLEDGANQRAEYYGALGAALSNGVEVKIADGAGNVVVDLTDGVPVTSNAGWAIHCYDASLKTWGAGNELLTVRWTFTNSGTFLRLDGRQGEELQVIFNDDLTGLVQHYYLAQGYKELTQT